MLLWRRPVAMAPIQTCSLGTSMCQGYGPKKAKIKKNFFFNLKNVAVNTKRETVSVI